MQSDLIQDASQRIEAVLSLLGVNFSKSGTWIQSCCPIHKGDNPTGFAWNCRTSRWTCFSNGCHIHVINDIVGLVQSVLNISRDESYKWLNKNVDFTGPVTVFEQEERIDRIYPECCLKKLLRSNYYRSRGFNEETCCHFEHGEAQAKEMRNRVVFPIRNDKGFIIGFSGRWLGEQKIIDGKVKCVTKTGTVVPKWKHTSFNKSNILYNFNDAKKYAEKEIIIVESIGNAMRWYNCGFKNVVACLGVSLSNKQCQDLISCSKLAIVAFDWGNAGQKGADRAKKQLEEFIDCIILTPSDERDWADLSDEETKRLYGTIRNI